MVVEIFFLLLIKVEVTRFCRMHWKPFRCSTKKQAFSAENLEPFHPTLNAFASGSFFLGVHFYYCCTALDKQLI